MTQEQVKKKLKKKFGTITNFANISGIERIELQKVFDAFYGTKDYYKQLLVKVNKLVGELETRPESNEITPEKLETLKAFINECGGVYKFCQANPEFSRDTLFQIVSGKRKRIGPVVKKLFEHFEIE